MSNNLTLDADLRAIDALNRQDTAAILAGDLSIIFSQWTDDFVALPPAGPIVRGRTANMEIGERAKAQIEAFEPLEHSATFDEVTVVGDYAFEWGTFQGASRSRADGVVRSYRGKLMRILQRQADGSWKMHRTMTSMEPIATAPR